MDELMVAVIAVDGRFPGAADVAAFWDNLTAGRCSIARLDEAALDAAGVPQALRAHADFVPMAANLADIDLFDAEFFGIGAREAQALDPQHRLLLEAARNALEKAGYDSSRGSAEIGAFFGIAISQYLMHNLLPQPQVMESLGDDFTVIGNYASYACTRIAHRLNLRGPVLALDTACSSSLVAVHLACKALLNFECEMALAGGVQINLPQHSGYRYQPGAFRSPDGVCRSFDAGAQGTVFGSGVGVVLLKRLEDARRDGDSVLAVIRSSAINNDGADKVGFSAPGIAGQTAVIDRALAFAGVDAGSIGYVETHGTGTPLGDPTEIAALTSAFRADTERRGYCAIGSLKPNIGHLETAAGIAGLIKAVLALHHRQLPPSLHFERPNPEIDFASSPFFVNTMTRDWVSDGRPRRAAVSSFGIGGSNAHLILEEYVEPPVREGDAPAPLHLLLWSAKSERALDAATARLAEHLSTHPQQDLADVAYTLQTGREVFSRRRMRVCDSRESALSALDSDSGALNSALADGKPATVAFLFPGQGAQHVDMAAALYRNERVFRTTVDRCALLLQPHLKLDLRTLLYPHADEAENAQARLGETWLTQPALFVVEYALACQWQAWGVSPDAMLGHSIGEYVAACLAGVFTLADALQLVALRGRLMQTLPAGDMLAVPLAEAELDTIGVDGWDLAAVNGPRACVLSGPAAVIDAVVSELGDRAIETRRLRTSHAFHSAMMEPILGPFAQALATIPRSAPTLRWVSNVSGDWITTEQAQSADYWVRHLRSTVRFADGVLRLLADPAMLLLEVGPGQTLSGLARQQPAARGRTVLASLPHARDASDAQAAMLTALGRLWLADVAIDWNGVHADQQRRRVLLPTYPFERKRYWVDPPTGTPTQSSLAPTAIAPRGIDQWLHAPVWIQRPALSRPLATPSGWVIFRDQGGVTAALTQALRERGESVVEVVAGDHFVDDGATITVRSALPEDYDRLLRALGARGAVGRIVHAWCVDRVGDDYARAQRIGFNSLLFLTQACARRPDLSELTLNVLSTGLADVTGSESLDALKASVLGLVQVIGQEQREIRCRSLDITADVDVATLCSELESPVDEIRLAIRAKRCWRLDYTAIAPDANAIVTPPWRVGGVYLITGGLGDLGLVFAEYLATRYQARLVLTARQGLPPRADWERSIGELGVEHPTRRRLQRLLALEASGAEVLVLAADVTDRAQMSGVIAAAKARFGAIHGLMHAAGVVGGGMLQFRKLAAADSVLAPKIRGAQLLFELTAGEALDVVVLHSSLFAITGGIGQGDYAAANAALDLLAHQHAQRAQRVVSINWDGWREVGMAARAGVFATELDGGIGVAAGIEALERVLARARGPQVIVSTWDLAHARASVAAPALPLLQQHARPALDTAFVPARDEAERKLVGIWRDVLGLREVGVHDNFFELGGTSLLLSESLRRIHAELDATVTITEMFQFPTIHALTARLTGNESSTNASGAAAVELGNRRKEALQRKRQRAVVA